MYEFKDLHLFSLLHHKALLLFRQIERGREIHIFSNQGLYKYISTKNTLNFQSSTLFLTHTDRGPENVFSSLDDCISTWSKTSQIRQISPLMFKIHLNYVRTTCLQFDVSFAEQTSQLAAMPEKHLTWRLYSVL